MNIALILSGGTGSRLGSEIPKQYIEVAGKSIIAYCMEVFEKMAEIDGIWVVADEKWKEYIRNFSGAKLKGFSAPGKNRQLSIWNGLQDMSSIVRSDDVIIIHDAARPLVTAQLIQSIVCACDNHDGALPVLPMKDTVYVGEEGRITGLLEREKMYAGQAPEAFLYGKYYSATQNLLPDRIMGIHGSTEPAIMEGLDIALVAGDERNFKITTVADLERFQELLRKM